MRIGVVSDTHIPKRAKRIPPKLLRAFEKVEFILHAGDLVELDVLRILGGCAPVLGVHGNMDGASVRAQLPPTRSIPAQGYSITIGLTHGHLGAGRTTPERARRMVMAPGVACVVFGHSHIPYNKKEGGVLLFNPGSPTDPRGRRPSYGILTVEADQIQGEIRFLDD